MAEGSDRGERRLKDVFLSPSLLERSSQSELYLVILIMSMHEAPTCSHRARRKPWQKRVGCGEAAHLQRQYSLVPLQACGRWTAAVTSSREFCIAPGSLTCRVRLRLLAAAETCSTLRKGHSIVARRQEMPGERGRPRWVNVGMRPAHARKALPYLSPTPSHPT